LIEDAACHRSLSEAPTRADQVRLAEETGRGLAVSTRLAHGIEAADLPPSLLRYRDTRGYLAQFDAITSGGTGVKGLSIDPEVQSATENLYVLA
ncbi:hypothetical protein ABTI51_18155, partial [Acinetobacter baumannii]